MIDKGFASEGVVRMSNSVAAVVDHDARAAIVWWVDLGHRPAGMSRMCGAWVFDESGCSPTLTNLTASRLIVATVAGKSIMDGNRVSAHRVVDVVGTRAAVAAERDQLQTVYERAATARKNGRNLIAPTWPTLPDEVDVEQISAPAGDARAGRSLAIARWLDDLCAAWDRIEEQRLARSYLRRIGGPIERSLPVVCILSEETSAV